VVFKTKLISVIPDDNKSPIELLKSRKAEIFIKVSNKDKGDVYLWEEEKFMDRLFVIRELVNHYFDTNQIPEMEGEDDPFWDPPQPQMIGLGYYKLEPLAYLIDNPHTVSLIGSDQKGLVGKLEVNILPTDETGWDEPPEDLIPYLPADLIGKRIDFAVIIERSIDLPDNFCRDVYCEYTFFLDDQVYSTPVIPGKRTSPVFDYRYHHNLMVTENTIKYLKNNAICFKVYGYPDNEHKPFYEPISMGGGDNSTMINSIDAKEIDNSTTEEASEDSKSIDFSIKDQSSQNISTEAVETSNPKPKEMKVKNYEEPQEPQDLQEPQEPQDPQDLQEPQESNETGEVDEAGEVNDQFDDMFIYGGQPSAQEELEFHRSRQFAQSVYEKPKDLISKKEQQKYTAAQPKDDTNLDGRGKKKKKRGKTGKDKKDCVIF
jgi:hypothetical protein